MGSLTSRPKRAPVATRPIIIQSAPPPAVPAVSTAPTSEDAAAGKAGSVQGGEAEKAGAEANLLKRRRGRLGTVLTSFRGVLSADKQGETQKSLLGE